MTKYNPKNERKKREYVRWLAEADGKNEKTIDPICKALLRYEEYTKFKDFASFNREQAIAFKKHLCTQKSERGTPLSKATCLTTLKALQSFFRWLAREAGYKSKIHISDIDYLSLTTKDARAARSASPKEFPSLEQIYHVIQHMPHTTDIEKRDRALIAFTILTGMRDRAIVSLNIKHVDCIRRLVIQDPREVDTKFSKRIDTFFFPIREDVVQIVLNWIDYLKTVKLYSTTAPLFPKTHIQQDEHLSFAAQGISQHHWKSTQAVRDIFRKAFHDAGLNYYSPHSFRHTLVHYGQEICQTPEQFKAWSQNLGHDSTLTTFTSYGTLSQHRQGEVMMKLWRKDD